MRVTWRQLRDEAPTVVADLRRMLRGRRRLLLCSDGPGAFRALPRDGSRRGAAGRGAFTGAAGGAACGDLSRISLLVEDGIGRAGHLRRRGLWGDAGGDGGRGGDGRRRAGARRGADRDRRGRRGDRRPDAGQAPRGPARRRRAAPGAGAGARLPIGALGGPAPVGERVLVAMSGGVDSAVAALLERERGAEVVGVTLKLWADPETDGAKACCSPEAVLGARGARPLARHPALHARPRGGVPPPRRRPSSSPATPPAARPTPASLCNGEVRIAAMVDLAERLGADAPRHRPLRPHRRGRRRPAARRRRRRGQGPELHAGGAAAGAAGAGAASRSPS